MPVIQMRALESIVHNLPRIADALESIAESLKALEKNGETSNADKAAQEVSK